MGRMIVEPGSTPQWIGNYGYRHKRPRRIFNSPNKYIIDEKEEKRLEAEVEEILLEKIEKSDKYTDEQRKLIQYTIKAQVRTYTSAIIRMAKEISDNENQEMQQNIDEAKAKEYYRVLREHAIKIAISDIYLRDDFDIDRAIKIEEDLKSQISNGEISKQEARKILEKPTLFEGIDLKYLRQLQSLLNRNEEPER